MIYFDNAATSFPKPPAVLKAAGQAIRFYGGNPGRSGHDFSLRAAEKVFSVRQKAADFFGVQPENVVFTLNCTMALNMAIKGALAGGGHAVTSSMEHNSVARPLHALSKMGKASYSVARVEELSPEKTLANFRSLLRSETKAIVCTYASNVSGTVLPIRELAAFCKEKGLLFIVDGAQAAGMLPINLERMGIDVLCVPGHKGLYGTTGTGMLLTREGVELAPLLEGGTGSSSLELDQPMEMPDRLESGTVNTPGIMTLGAGMDFVSSRTVEAVYRYEMSLCGWVYRELSAMSGVKPVAGSFKMGEKAPLVSFNLEGVDSAAVAEALNRAGFALRGGFHCAGLAHQTLGTEKQGAVRFSPSHFNSTEEVGRFLATIKKFQKNGLLRG